MGRKRAQRKGLPRVHEEGPASSASSQASDASLDDIFENHIENLFEKRQAARMHGLQGIVSMLCSSVLKEECMAREETLRSLFIHSLLKGKGAEPILAGRALGLLVITLGLDRGSERIWTSSAETLLKIAYGTKVDVACSAIDAYAAGCFVAEDDMLEILESMEKLKGLWIKANSRIKEKSIRAWTLLLSSLSNRAPLDSIFESISTLRSYLDDNDVGVRSAAGECLALMHSMGVDDDEVTDDSCSDGVSIASSSTCFSRHSAMDEAFDKMKDLSHGRGDRRRKSKRDKIAQRSAFRDICSFVEDGAFHETKIKLQHGDLLIIDELSSLIHLNFIRTLLAEGFQVHIQSNSLLHQIFDYAPRIEREDRLSRQEKRMYKSPSSYSSKKRSVGRGAARSQKDWLMSGDGLI